MIKLAAALTLSAAALALSACSASSAPAPNCPAADYDVTAVTAVTPNGHTTTINVTDPRGGVHKVHWSLAHTNDDVVVRQGELTTNAGGAATTRVNTTEYAGNQGLHVYVSSVDGCDTRDRNAQR